MKAVEHTLPDAAAGTRAWMLPLNVSASSPAPARCRPIDLDVAADVSALISPLTPITSSLPENFQVQRRAAGDWISKSVSTTLLFFLSIGSRFVGIDATGTVRWISSLTF